MGIFTTLPFGVLRRNSAENFEGLRKLGIDTCPECKEVWNSSDRTPVQEKCGHVKCRRCFIKTFVAVKDTCPQCIPTCPECKGGWDEHVHRPIQENCGHIKCRKCFGKNLVGIFRACPQCRPPPDWSEAGLAAGPPESRLVEEEFTLPVEKEGPEIIIGSSPSPRKSPAKSPPRSPPKRMEHIPGRRASHLETSPRVKQEKERRRSTGTVPVKVFEAKWEKKMQESTFKKKTSFMKRTVFTHSKITKTVQSGKVSKKSAAREFSETVETETSPKSNGSNNNTNTMPEHIILMGSETNPIYECRKCLKKFKTRQNIKYHAFCGEETRKPFKCDICPRWFAIKSHFKYHMMTHGKDMPFKCTLCPKTYARQLELTRHVKFHSADRPFVCEKCGRTFHTQNILDNHMYIHGGRPFQCKYCSKSFARLVFLNKHELIHVTGEKPFKCRMCETSLCRKDGLERHVLNVHKIDPRTSPEFAYLYKSAPKPHNWKKGWKSKAKANLPPPEATIKTEVDADIKNVERVPQSVVNEPCTNNPDGSKVNPTVPESPESWKKTITETIIEENSMPQPLASTFETINRQEFLDLKLESSFSRPFICPMCGNSFAQQEDVDWHVRIMHSASNADNSCSSQSDNGVDTSRTIDDRSENNPGNILALFNGQDPSISYQILPHVAPSSEFLQPIEHLTGNGSNMLEFTSTLSNLSNPEFPEVTNGGFTEYIIETAQGFSEPFLAGHEYNHTLNAHYIEPAPLTNGPGFTPSEIQSGGTEPGKFDDLISLSSSFMYDQYEPAPSQQETQEQFNNGIFSMDSAQNNMQVQETEYAPPTDNPKTYTDLCNAYTE